MIKFLKIILIYALNSFFLFELIMSNEYAQKHMIIYDMKYITSRF